MNECDEKRETIADIVTDLRQSADSAFPYDVDAMNICNSIADRIEAAWKRERVEAVGNAAAMYDALVKIAHYCDDKNGMDDPYCADGHILSDIARAALFAQQKGAAADGKA